MKKMQKKYISNVFLLVLLALALACSNNKAEPIEIEEEGEGHLELTQAQYDQANIQIGRVQKQIIGSELSVNGVIDVPPQSNISINVPYGGFVKYTEMLPGTQVKKGQLLVEIENPEFIQFQQEYLESIASREFLKSEFERQKALYEENVASGKTFQQAKSTYLMNEAKLKTMEQRLKLIGFSPEKIALGKVASSVKIYSPVSGAVRNMYTNIGKYVAPQDAIMDITNAEDLHVELTVYESDIPKVKKGQRIRFNLTNASEPKLDAEVFLVGSGVREDRSMTVHGHMEQKYEGLLPGMYVSASIELGSHEAWVVPDNTIVRFDGKNYIFAYREEKVEDGITMHEFEMLEVVKGNTEEGNTEVDFVGTSFEMSEIQLITKGAYVLLAKAKNGGEGGHAH